MANLDKLFVLGDLLDITIDFIGKPTRYLARLKGLIPRGQERVGERLDLCSDQLILHVECFLLENGFESGRTTSSKVVLPLIEGAIKSGKIRIVRG
jgi:hypothetical protein